MRLASGKASDRKNLAESIVRIISKNKVLEYPKIEYRIGIGHLEWL